MNPDAPPGPSDPRPSESSQPSSRIEPDTWTDDDDEGYAQSLSTSYLTSIATDIRRGVVENGRTYAAYGMHKPWLPVDDEEVSELPMSRTRHHRNHDRLLTALARPQRHAALQVCPSDEQRAAPGANR